jgi:hypothetical protein
MTTEAGRNWRPDGAVRYRTDPASGQRVGVLPETCKRGQHSLHQVGYTARTRPPDLLVIACNACRAALDPDYAWTLTLTQPTPPRAELDDMVYLDIEPHFIMPGWLPGRVQATGRLTTRHVAAAGGLPEACGR